MAALKEQHVCIIFSFKPGNIPQKLLKCWKWLLESRQLEEYKYLNGFSRFKRGVTSVEYAKCLGCLWVSEPYKNVARVKELVLENRRVAIREVFKTLGISFQSVQNILKDRQPETWNSVDWFLHHDKTPATQLCLCVNFWLKTKLLSFHHTLHLTRLSTVWLLSFPKTPKWCWRGGDLVSPWFKKNHRMYWSSFKHFTSLSASNDGVRSELAV
jgi:hypothetical protein